MAYDRPERSGRWFFGISAYSARRTAGPDAGRDRPRNRDSGALLFGRALRTLLFKVQSTDMLTCGVVGLAFFVIAIIACALPARRAASVDPMAALRGN